MSKVNASAESVLVVVAPDFGEKLMVIPMGRPVWITMSPANEPIVRSLWESRKSTNHLTGTTGFRFDREISAEDRFRAELDAIDLHHGPNSSTSPCTEIKIVGARLTAEILADLSDLGFTNVTETEDGFAAKRTHEEAMRRRE